MFDMKDCITARARKERGKFKTSLTFDFLFFFIRGGFVAEFIYGALINDLYMVCLVDQGMRHS